MFISLLCVVYVVSSATSLSPFRRPDLGCCAPPPKEQLYWQWKESVIVPVHRKGDTTHYIKNQGLSCTSYIKIFSVFLS